MAAVPRILLVPVDGSKGSTAAAELAVELGERLGAPVRLLFAFPDNPVDYFGLPGDSPRAKELKYFSPDAFAGLRDRTAEEVFKVTREALGSVRIDLQERLLPGEPWHAIIEHANGEAHPMIVMGRRGRGSLRELLVGSVSQRVLHHATCPVTVVR